MKIGLIGFGKMGALIKSLADKQQDEVFVFDKQSALTDKPDVYLDFSAASAVMGRLHELKTLKRPIVIGTTGWEHELDTGRKLVEQYNMTALYAPNFATGMIRFYALIAQACSLLHNYDKAGVDTHHKDKKDAPSGTARFISQTHDIAFTSVRVGSAPASIQVLFDGQHDTICLSHTAKSKIGFAQGALCVAKWLVSQTGWKTLDDYLHSTDHSL